MQKQYVIVVRSDLKELVRAVKQEGRIIER